MSSVVAMGFFSKDPDKVAAKQEKASAKAQEAAEETRAKAIELSEKARAKAAKRGVTDDGSIDVGYSFADAEHHFLVVFPDRVELVSAGSVISKWPAGTETIPMSRISSVDCTKTDGVWAVLEVHTSGNTLIFKLDQGSRAVRHLSEVILEQMNSSTGSTARAADAPGVDAADHLRKLGELHQAGIVTDEEFAMKKAELLERL